MDIQILELIEGAGKAEGLTVVIDVLRAFSLECYLFARGAKKILAVGKEETARRLKQEHPDYVLIGERGGVMLPGFDYGNSPFQTMDGDFAGKTIIHTTSAGTQGLAAASTAPGADEILTGSLVNASAIARYIRRRNPDKVSLVAMGTAGKTSGAEDVLCAKYIRDLLQVPALEARITSEKGTESLREDPLVLELREKLRAKVLGLKDSGYAAKFFDPEGQKVFPQEDFWLCTKPDQFDFVLHVSRTEDDIFTVERE